eukprot:4930964-Pyramimonas_sp.AAC.1
MKYAGGGNALDGGEPEPPLALPLANPSATKRAFVRRASLRALAAATRRCRGAMFACMVK